jgi:cell division protein FtsB
MEENIILALITAVGGIITAYFKLSLKDLNTTVEYQGQQIERLETVETELKEENKKLRDKIEQIIESYDKRIKDLHDKLYKALQPKSKGGIF